MSTGFLLANNGILQYTHNNMKAETIQKLLEINKNFYEEFSDSFSSTRYRAQSGTNRFIAKIPSTASVIDLGCGNGTFARALIENGFSGKYMGCDLSQGLIEHAIEQTGQPASGQISFEIVDLADTNWTTRFPNTSYDWLVCFAVLHHIPGDKLRRKIVNDFKELLNQDGKATVSIWQWQNSARLFSHVLPWSQVGIVSEDVDEGDVLLDWRAGDTPGIRYVHTFTETTLSELAKSGGFEVEDSFYSDGKSGDLALYQIWK